MRATSRIATSGATPMWSTMTRTSPVRISNGGSNSGLRKGPNGEPLPLRLQTRDKGGVLLVFSAVF